ncbi:MAG TPA: hypothetical protein VJA66_03085 [Thermoanaerobaculia bacterium]
MNPDAAAIERGKSIASADRRLRRARYQPGYADYHEKADCGDPSHDCCARHRPRLPFNQADRCEARDSDSRARCAGGRTAAADSHADARGHRRSTRSGRRLAGKDDTRAAARDAHVRSGTGSDCGGRTSFADTDPPAAVSDAGNTAATIGDTPGASATNGDGSSTAVTAGGGRRGGRCADFSPARCPHDRRRCTHFSAHSCSADRASAAFTHVHRCPAQGRRRLTRADSDPDRVAGPYVDGDPDCDRIALAGAAHCDAAAAFAAADRNTGAAFPAADVYSFHAAALAHGDDIEAHSHAQAGGLLRGPGILAGRDLHAHSGEEEEIAEIDRLESLRAGWRDRFRAGAAAAFRDWFRLQEEIGDNEDDVARALANDLWDLIPELRFDTDADRGRFLHNVAVFFGSPGAAADLARARRCFMQALESFSAPDEGGWHARILHNFASAISNLGNSRDELRESVAMFEQALAWRTAERAIARGVSLHNMGIVLRRLVELDPDNSPTHLAASAAAFREAAAIREAHGLVEGHALSLFHLGLTLEAAGQSKEAGAAFASAADEFEQLGKTDSAAIARARVPSLP